MSLPSSQTNCPHCSNIFKHKKNLYVHLRKNHNVEPLPDKPIKAAKCNSCRQLFSSKITLRRHIKTFHLSHLNNEDHIYSRVSTRESRIVCPHETCRAKFLNNELFRNHLVQEHSFEIKLEHHQFNSVEAFEQWKDQIQQKNMSYYSMDSSKKKLGNGTEKKYFNCHRSFNYKPRGKTIRNLKSTGTNKIGATCPSRMEVTILANSVNVKFWSNHYYHQLQLGHVLLDKESRAEIAGKLKEGVSFNHILDSVRDTVKHLSESNPRLTILDRKDLYNIVRDFHIDYGTKRHANDAISIKLWVAEMQAMEEECPILYYKGQDEEDSNTLLNKSDFALMIMTTFQAQQLVKFGCEKICIDGTHGTNAYDIQLYTIMTVDEWGTGCPVAFCFSNRSDEYIFFLFFDKIKTCVGTINANVFMSDDAPAFYNAWFSIMGHVPNRLLCTWHVDKNWKSNLNKIKGGQEKKEVVYKTLRVLLQITSKTDFHNSMDQTIIDLLSDDDTKAYGEYFKNHYCQRPEVWAYCYRIGLGINTNMYLESHHKILKHIYLEGRKVKRLDKTVNAVMKIARDSFFKRLIKLCKNAPSQRSQKIICSHKRSESIKKDMIKTIEEGNEWLVSSQSSSSEYCVNYIQEMCAESCMNCLKCCICIHSFKCSCIDNVIKMNICKHIHAVVNFFCLFKRNNKNSNKPEPEVAELINISQISSSSVSYSTKIAKKAEIILGLSSKYNVNEEKYNFIEKQLDKVISVLNDENNNFKETEQVNVTQKVEKQVRLYSTKRKTKHKINMSKPTMNDIKNIKEGLKHGDKVLYIHSGFDHDYCVKSLS